ncbi:MAG: crossover junction endodeoxyribonuclease RuvC [Acidimicrobiales bacterium]
MFVLGIDPGLSRCGYCVLDVDRRGSSRAVAIGVLTTPVELPVPERLAILQRDVRELLDDYPPSSVGIERVLFQVNVSTAMSVGQASGIVMAEAASRGCTVVEYSPNQVKEAVTGNGAADKEQVQEMVRRLLGQTSVLRPADAADAAAVALCHVAYAPALMADRSPTAAVGRP